MTDTPDAPPALDDDPANPDDLVGDFTVSDAAPEPLDDDQGRPPEDEADGE